MEQKTGITNSHIGLHFVNLTLACVLKKNNWHPYTKFKKKMEKEQKSMDHTGQFFFFFSISEQSLINFECWLSLAMGKKERH